MSPCWRRRWPTTPRWSRGSRACSAWPPAPARRASSLSADGRPRRARAAAARSACPRSSCTAPRSWSGTCATRATWPSTSPARATSSWTGVDSFPFVGDSDAIVEEIEEFLTGGRGGGELARALLTVMFTDIVDATARAAELGDGRWRDLLARHDEEVRKELAPLRRPRGQDGRRRLPGDLRRAALARAALRAGDHRRPRASSGIEVRVGMHTGECELIGDDVGGMAVHIASRVSGARRPRRGARLGHRVRHGRRRAVRVRGPRLSRAQGRARAAGRCSRSAHSR